MLGKASKKCSHGSGLHRVRSSIQTRKIVTRGLINHKNILAEPSAVPTLRSMRNIGSSLRDRVHEKKKKRQDQSLSF